MTQEANAQREKRRLTLIVIPHGDLETRTFEISYRKLKFGLIMAGVLMLVVAVALAFWFPIAVQAGRVRGLETQVAQLEQEREKVTELEALLAEVEAQYERVRELLGADGDSRDSPLLPPLRPDSGSSAAGAASGDEGGGGDDDDAPPRDTASLPDEATAERTRWSGPDIAQPSSAAIHAVQTNAVSETGADAISRIRGNRLAIETVRSARQC